ncbi:MAG TPA: Xaa-Pro peptidase family protein [Gemmatimonadales bacterium]|jgi:Xaa-Pro aminopeptidase
MRSSILLLAWFVLGAPVASGQIPDSEYAARRAALLDRIDSGVVLAAGARDPIAHYPAFSQLPAFRYLTGYLDPDAFLVLVKRGSGVSGTLLVPPTDLRAALYSGRTTDPDALARTTGLEVRYLEVLAPLLDSLARTSLPFYVIGDFVSNEFAADDSLSYMRALVRRLRDRYQWLETRDATPFVDQLRARKSRSEQALLRKAAEISAQGHRSAMRMIAPGRTENEVQAEVEYAFRRLGGDGPAYASIVGSGPNSTTLHYDAGRRVLQNGEVVLMDVAAAYDGYAADVTRTVPVNGRFSPEQRAIYQLVLEAQKASEQAIRPGVPAQLALDAIRGVLKAGLARLGLIESADAGFDAPPGLCPARPIFRGEREPCPQWYLFTYHGYSHGIGLDVHDPAQFSDVPAHTFQVGDAFTIEPGVYVRGNALEGLPDTPRNRAMIEKIRPAIERYRNIGVRIEDDYFVTETGLERVSPAPREIAEIEALMKPAKKR